MEIYEAPAVPTADSLRNLTKVCINRIFLQAQRTLLFLNNFLKPNIQQTSSKCRCLLHVLFTSFSQSSKKFSPRRENINIKKTIY